MDCYTYVDVGDVQSETHLREVALACKIVVAVVLSGVGVAQTSQTEGDCAADIREYIDRQPGVEREIEFVDVGEARFPDILRQITEIHAA